LSTNHPTAGLIKAEITKGIEKYNPASTLEKLKRSWNKLDSSVIENLQAMKVHIEDRHMNQKPMSRSWMSERLNYSFSSSSACLKL
jgi:hypothetical protein